MRYWPWIWPSIVVVVILTTFWRTRRSIRDGDVRAADERAWVSMIGSVILLPTATHFAIGYLSKFGRAACVPFMECGEPASVLSFAVDVATSCVLPGWIVAGSGAGVIARLLPTRCLSNLTRPVTRAPVYNLRHA